MKPETFTSHPIIIRGKLRNDIEWKSYLSEVKLPSKTIFSVTGIERFQIKKIVWDFGDTTKDIIITNRKEDPAYVEVPHIFREKNCLKMTTVSVCASVYTEANTLFITPLFTVEPCKSKSNNYVDPIIFKAQIGQFYIDDDMTDELAISIQQISNRLSYAPNFINYTYREEMVGDALIKMFQALREHKFDPDKGNPFSYFTKIAFHAFCNRIKGEKKLRDTHNQYQEFVYDSLMSNTTSHSREDHYNGGYEE